MVLHLPAMMETLGSIPGSEDFLEKDTANSTQCFLPGEFQGHGLQKESNTTGVTNAANSQKACLLSAESGRTGNISQNKTPKSSTLIGNG